MNKNEPIEPERPAVSGAMTGSAIGEAEKTRRRNILGGINVEDGMWADCLAIALLCYFERHMDCPEDAEKDDNGNNQWAVDKTNAALDRIAAECWPNAEGERQAPAQSRKPIVNQTT
jgi:hypothetical protein